jgi:uncharacterized protein (UPF0297 family)
MNPPSELSPSYLESLPPEVVTSILLQLPNNEIEQLCNLSTYLASFCRDWNFWALKAKQNLGFPQNLFRETSLPNPRQRYRQIQNYSLDLTKSIQEAVIEDQPQLVDYLLSRDPSNLVSLWEEALIESTIADNLPLFERLFSRHVNADADRDKNIHTDLLTHLSYLAGKYNNQQIINYILHHHPTHINNILIGAVNGRHRNLIQYLLQHGGRINAALLGAASSGNLDLTREFVQAGANNLRVSLLFAKKHNHMDVVEYLDSLLHQQN